MKKNILIKVVYSLFILLLFVRCQTTTKKYYHDTGELLSEIEYNEEGQKDGELREYYKTGELKTLEFYKDNKLVDTTFGFNKKGKLVVKRYEEKGNSIFERYYENGKLLSRGNMKDTIAEGWWNYYDENGNLYRKVEFVDASSDSLTKKKQHPNQILSLDTKGDIVKDSSNYYTLDIKDTVPLKKVTIGYLDLAPQISKKSDFYWVYFWQEDKFGNKTKVDTTYGKNNQKAKFWLFPEKVGEITLKGVVLEEGTEARIDERDTTMADIISIKKKMFFEKEIFVKDTISGSK